MTEKKTSHNLADVSRPAEGSHHGHDGGSDAERRRMPRLNLTSEQFRLAMNGKIFSVYDLSLGGMALRVLDPADLRVFTVGAQLDGTLNLNREKHSVHARVRHVGTELVGCEFEGLDASVSEALVAFFDPKTLGQELRPIPAAENGALWYHGPSGTDLLLWRGNDGQYRRFALFVLGSFVQWEVERGVTTGRVGPSFEKSEVRGVVRFETMLLEADSRPDVGKLSIAKTLLLSSNLPQDLRGWCVRHLEITQ